MDNKDQAANIIAHGLKNGDSPARIARHLADYGLLAEDLPEPSYTVTGCKEENPVWEATTQFKVEADPDSQELYIWNDYGPAETLSLAKANTMRRALHAAEVYLEEA